MITKRISYNLQPQSKESSCCFNAYLLHQNKTKCWIQRKSIVSCEIECKKLFSSFIFHWKTFWRRKSQLAVLSNEANKKLFALNKYYLSWEYFVHISLFFDKGEDIKTKYRTLMTWYKMLGRHKWAIKYKCTSIQHHHFQ